MSKCKHCGDPMGPTPATCPRRGDGDTYPCQPEVTIADFIATHGITMEVNDGTDVRALRAKPIVKDADGWKHYAWSVTLVRANERLTSPYSTGIGIVSAPARVVGYATIREIPATPKPPEIATVLDNMASDSAGYENARGFDDWCADYGYDTDSRKAEKVYNAVAEQAKALRYFLGREAYETLLWGVERE